MHTVGLTLHLPVELIEDPAAAMEGRLGCQSQQFQTSLAQPPISYGATFCASWMFRVLDNSGCLHLIGYPNLTI